MNDLSPEDDLLASLVAALKVANFTKPNTHDCTEADAYYRDCTAEVIANLHACGWTLETKVPSKE